MASDFIIMNAVHKKNLMKHYKDLRFVNRLDIPFDLTCFICSEIAVEHLFSECGILFCKRCMNLNDDCPHCEINGMRCRWSENPSIEIRVMALQVRCLNRPHCSCVLSLLELPAHLLQCTATGCLNLVLEGQVMVDQSKKVPMSMVVAPKSKIYIEAEKQFKMLECSVKDQIEAAIELTDSNINADTLMTKLLKLKLELAHALDDCFIAIKCILTEPTIVSSSIFDDDFKLIKEIVTEALNIADEDLLEDQYAISSSSEEEH